MMQLLKFTLQLDSIIRIHSIHSQTKWRTFVFIQSFSKSGLCSFPLRLSYISYLFFCYSFLGTKGFLLIFSFSARDRPTQYGWWYAYCIYLAIRYNYNSIQKCGQKAIAGKTAA